MSTSSSSCVRMLLTSSVVFFLHAFSTYYFRLSLHDDRLDDKGLDPTSSATEAMAFVKKISQGTEGDLLMTIDEFEALATRANQSEPLNDPTHMVCPGKVVTMYDDWTKDDSDEQKTADEDTGEVETPTAIGFVVTEDVGTARVLKLIEWNERMISDHFSEDYRSSIQSVTNLVS